MTAAEPSETAGAATPDATEQQASPPQTTEAPKGESLKKPVDAVEGPIPPIGDIPAVPVSIDETAKPSKSSSIRLVSTKTVKAVGTGIGEISGPAIEVTIEISNSGSKTLKLDAADVSAYYGPAGVPASPVTSDPAHKALPESVPAGNSVRGVYIFGVPKDEREAVSIVVMTEHGSAPVIFAGKV